MLARTTCHFLAWSFRRDAAARELIAETSRAESTDTEPSIMPVELRKRKAPVAPPAPAPSRKKAATSKAKKPAAAKAKEEVKKPEAKGDKPLKDDEATDTAPESAEEKEAAKELKEDAKDEPKDDKKKPAAAGKIAVGDVIDLEGFGGEVQTNDGEKTTLKKLVDDSKSGVVLFTYPKASTPGCKSFLSFFPQSPLCPHHFRICQP